jgi:hypothetical protein
MNNNDKSPWTAAAEALQSLLRQIGEMPPHFISANESTREDAQRLNDREDASFEKLTETLDRWIEGNAFDLPNKQEQFFLHRRVMFAFRLALVLAHMPTSMTANQALRWLLHTAYIEAREVGLLASACMIACDT